MGGKILIELFSLASYINRTILTDVMYFNFVIFVVVRAQIVATTPASNLVVVPAVTGTLAGLLIIGIAAFLGVMLYVRMLANLC